MPVDVRGAPKQIATEPLQSLTRWLDGTLGHKLCARALDIDADLIKAVARGEAQADPETERRLRNLYSLVYYLSTQEGPDGVFEWLTQPHDELDDRPPIELLREDEGTERVWFAAAPDF
jgi:hypothetical protein